MNTLLCPVHLPFSFMALGLGLLAASAALPLALAYRLLWRLRYHRAGLLDQGVRLHGRIVGPQPRGAVVYGRREGKLVAEPFTLLAGGQALSVTPTGALLRGWPRRVRVGQRVTVDGLPSALCAATERLYRDPAHRPGIVAVQIARGTWPALRPLVPALLLLWAGCLVLLFSFHLPPAL